MRKLIVTEFVTLDGIMEAPEQWVFEFHTDETAKFKLDEMLHADALVLGKNTNEETDMTQPVQGPAYYFPSIEKKHGRPINEWIDLIRSCELTKHKELVDWLKTEVTGHP